MANLNRVFLIGNLTKDPELRQTDKGIPVARFGLAVNQRYIGADSEKKEKVCFIDIVAFSKLAESCTEYLKKGKSVFVEGRLNQNRWEKEGQKRSKLEVVARTVQFLSPPKN